MNEYITFTKKEKTIRKAWLITLILFTITSIICYCLYIKNVILYSSPVEIENIHFLTMCFGIIVINVILFALYYHCSYKQCGTKLLAFSLILFYITIFSLLLTITVKLVHKTYDFHVIIPLTIALAWVIYISFRMKKINANYKSQINNKIKPLINQFLKQYFENTSDT